MMAATTPTDIPPSATPDAADSSVLPSPLSYRGRIGRGGYWIAMACCVFLLFAGMAGASQLMNPTGADASFFLVFPGLIGFFWLHSVATINRLRDAGLHPLWYVVFGGGLFAWFAATIEFIEILAWLIPIVALVIVTIPGIMPSIEQQAKRRSTG